jgi:hypothetical protein
VAWTEWRLLAKKGKWYDDTFDYDGPSCYELGTGYQDGSGIQIHYVGETSNEETRMGCYGKHGSHLSEIIDDHLNRGWCLFYRGRSHGSKPDALAMQNSLLASYKYDWNIMLNVDDDDEGIVTAAGFEHASPSCAIARSRAS